MVTNARINLNMKTARISIMRKRAQISMEYMVIVGFTLFMIMPIIIIYGAERQSMKEQVNAKQAQNIGRKIVDAAETMYYLGKPSKTTLKIYMPPHIQNITIANNEIIFKMQFGSLITDVPSPYSTVNLSGSISTKQGLHFIDIAADDYQVNITTIQD